MTIFINGKDVSKSKKDTQDLHTDTHETDVSEFLNITLANAKYSEYYIFQQTYSLLGEEPPTLGWKGLRFFRYLDCMRVNYSVGSTLKNPINYMKQYYFIVSEEEVPERLKGYDKRFSDEGL